MSSWGGFAQIICEDFNTEDMPKESQELKARLEFLDSSKTLDEIVDRLKPFTERERNYLNSPLLDELFVTTFPTKKTFIYKNYFLANNFYKQRGVKSQAAKRLSLELIKIDFLDDQIAKGDSTSISLKFDTIIEMEKTAIKYGAINVFKIIASNMNGAEREYCLYDAVKYRQKEIILYLLQTMYVHPQFFENVVKYGDNEMCEIFLNNCGDATHDIFLRFAIEQNKHDLCDYLLREMKEQDAVKYEYSFPAAVKNGRFDLIEYMIKDTDQNTISKSLIICAEDNDLKCAKILLDHEAAIQVNGFKAIETAFDFKHFEFIKLLLKYCKQPCPNDLDIEDRNKVVLFLSNVYKSR